MPPSRPSHTVEAFYAVGRNVVNFQRLEQILKRLASSAPISAPLSILQSSIATQKAKAERLTLGNAVKKWLEIAYHTEPRQGLELENEIMVSFGFVLEWRSGVRDQLAAELESLLQERNSLIHLDMAQLNFEDEAECSALSKRLEAQNDRILKALKALEGVLRKLEEVRLWIDSDEGQQEIAKLCSEFAPH